jgi:uncharacterized membrane protein HdeD (DUF308 family)
MINDPEEKRSRTSAKLRSIYDYVMGVLWLALGIVFLAYEKFNLDLKLDPVLRNIFGVAAILYGAFRIYRGFKNK